MHKCRERLSYVVKVRQFKASTIGLYENLFMYMYMYLMYGAVSEPSCVRYQRMKYLSKTIKAIIIISPTV